MNKQSSIFSFVVWWYTLASLYLMRKMRQTNSFASCTRTTIWLVARWCIYIVLINISEFLIHCIAVQGFTLIWSLLSTKITCIDELMIRFIRYHGVAPPICHGPQVVVIVVSNCISYLHLSQKLKWSNVLLTHYTDVTNIIIWTD